jgi:hypothetical protein
MGFSTTGDFLVMARWCCFSSSSSKSIALGTIVEAPFKKLEKLKKKCNESRRSPSTRPIAYK